MTTQTVIYNKNRQELPYIFFLTLSEMRLTISECLAMSKYAAMSKWQLSSTLASFPLLADYLSVKLTSKVSFNLSRAAQTVEFLPDNIALVNKRLQRQITNSLGVVRVEFQNSRFLTRFPVNT